MLCLQHPHDFALTLCFSFAFYALGSHKDSPPLYVPGYRSQIGDYVQRLPLREPRCPSTPHPRYSRAIVIYQETKTPHNGKIGNPQCPHHRLAHLQDRYTAPTIVPMLVEALRLVGAPGTTS